MGDFNPLTCALQSWFDSDFADLPEAVQERVKQEFFASPWADFTPSDRRAIAAGLDYLNDPATEAEREFCLKLVLQKDALDKKIAEWESAPASTPTELAEKETRLGELIKLRSRMEHQALYRAFLYVPECKRSDCKNSTAISNRGEFEYLPFPKAYHLLSKRMTATTEEIAAWVFLGPENHGISAYLNAGESAPPTRFRYSYDGVNSDYIGPLMACWFRADQLAAFQPRCRYITCPALIERWSKKIEIPNFDVHAFIRAKIAESRLNDIHPLTNLTQWCADENFPPKKEALFELTHIEEIERHDFGFISDPTCTVDISPTNVGTPEWRRKTAAAAANTLHDLPGGSREKHRQIREAWASGKYSSRDRCAEEECGALGMSYSAARRALRKTPDP